MSYKRLQRKLEKRLAELDGYKSELEKLKEYSDLRDRLAEDVKGTPFEGSVLSAFDDAYRIKIEKIEQSMGGNSYHPQKHRPSRRQSAKVAPQHEPPAAEPQTEPAPEPEPLPPASPPPEAPPVRRRGRRPREPLYGMRPLTSTGKTDTANASEAENMITKAYDLGFAINDLAIIRETSAGDVVDILSRGGKRIRDSAEDDAAKSRLLRMLKLWMDRGDDIDGLAKRLGLSGYSKLIKKYVNESTLQ